MLIETREGSFLGGIWIIFGLLFFLKLHQMTLFDSSALKTAFFDCFSPISRDEFDIMAL